MNTQETTQISPRAKFSQKNSRGFTLVEMMVSLGLFIIIMLIATSALLSVVDADRKARRVRVAIDNLNLALENMTRRIKTGSTYYCGSVDTGTTGDCLSGGSTLYFTGQDGLRTKYMLSGTTILRTVGAYPPLQVTSSEINITGLKFIVYGTASYASTDRKQPVVVVLIDGSLGSGKTGSTFKIQTTITQRSYDN